MTSDQQPTASSLTLAATMKDDLIALRREIHADPEIALDLPRTQQRILTALEGLDLEITLGRGLSSVVAVLRGGARSENAPVVLLRGDMDALPVDERTGHPFASTNGAMHACGHDLHVAGLVGAARILHERRAELRGDVVFMFQPGEEGPGGAAPMIDEGLLDVAGRRVDAAFALHVTSAQHPVGVWFGRPGPLMAAADKCFITVRGKGGHGSAPHTALDPVPVACAIVLGLQTMLTRRFDAFDPVVVTAGKIAAGTKENIIPDTATIDLTVRSFSATHRDKVQQEIIRVAEGTAAAHAMTADVDYHREYPVTVNEEAEYSVLRDAVLDLFGPERYLEMPFPEAGSEDFSFVAEQVPSAYIFVSACVGDPSEAADNHSPIADFDDVVVPDAAALLAEVAVRRLGRPAG